MLSAVTRMRRRGLYRVQVWFDRLAAVNGRHGELFARTGPVRERAAALSATARYAGAKIAYGRIPGLEDFR